MKKPEKRIKVVEFIWALSDGGAETLVKNYALMLNKEKFDVKILTLYDLKNTSNSKILKENGISIHSIFKKHNLFTKVFEKIFHLSYIPREIKKYIEKEHPDCIHIHLRFTKYFSKISDSLVGIKLFYSCHSDCKTMFPTAEYKASRLLIERNKMQLIALHPAMKKELDDLFGISNTEVVYNLIDAEKFRNISVSKTEMRKELGIPQNSFVMGNVGRFCVEKNHLFILKIFNSVLADCPDSFLLLVGDGETKTTVKKEIDRMQISNSVIILSHRSDVNKILKAMDVFIFPSTCEGFGNALTEAQLSGLKCVTSDRIPRENIFSEKTLVLSLDDELSLWKEAILNSDMRNENYTDIADTGILTSISKLESLYER